MPCLPLLLGLAFPRVVLLCMLLFTNMLGRTFHGLLFPLLGFIFLPITTVVYTLLVTTGYPVGGLYLVALIICAVADLGLIGRGASRLR